MNTQLVLVNTETNEATFFSTITDAAQYLRRDTSTVSRALSGDRNCRTVAGHVAVAVPEYLLG
jgi:hypothetical protein